MDMVESNEPAPIGVGFFHNYAVCLHRFHNFDDLLHFIKRTQADHRNSGDGSPRAIYSMDVSHDVECDVPRHLMAAMGQGLAHTACYFVDADADYVATTDSPTGMDYLCVAWFLWFQGRNLDTDDRRCAPSLRPF